MIRAVFVLSAVLGFCACNATRGGGDGGEDDPPPTTPNPGPSYAWLVLTTIGETESVSHSFVRWNRGSGLCEAAADHYEGRAAGYTEYYAASTALSQDFETVPDPESDPEYRLRFCELTIAFSASLFTGDLYTGDSDVLAVSLLPSNSEPAEGTYVPDDGNPLNQGDNPDFTANRTLYLTDYASLISPYDCESYANDPDAELFEDAEDGGFAEYWSLVEGTLDVVAAGDDAWQLTLNDGVEAADDDGVEGPLQLDGAFERCEVEYSIGR